MSVATAASVVKANNMSNSFVVYKCPDLGHKFVVTARYMYSCFFNSFNGIEYINVYCSAESSDVWGM